jgi:hypothetical protein
MGLGIIDFIEEIEDEYRERFVFVDLVHGASISSRPLSSVAQAVSSSER